MPNWAKAGRQGWKYLKPIFDDLPDHFDWLISPRSGEHASEISRVEAIAGPGPAPRFPSTVEQALGSKKMPKSMSPDKLHENLIKHGARQSELDYIDLDAIPVNEKGKVTLEAISEAHDQSLLAVLSGRRSGVGGLVQGGRTHSEQIRHLRGQQTHNNARGDISSQVRADNNIALEREIQKMEDILEGNLAPDGRPWSEASEDYPELYRESMSFEHLRAEQPDNPGELTLEGYVMDDRHEAMAMRQLGTDDPNDPEVMRLAGRLFQSEEESREQFSDAVMNYRRSLSDYDYTGKGMARKVPRLPVPTWSEYTPGGAKSPATRHYESLIRDQSGSPFRIDSNYFENLSSLRDEFKHGGDFSEIKTHPHSGDHVLGEGVPIPLTNDHGLHYHWDEPNVLAHTRSQDVVVHDPVTGRPVRGLNINEIQSDYAQSARKIWDDIVDIRFQDRLRSGDLDFFNEITAGIDDIGGRTRATNLTPDDIRRGFTEGTGYDPEFADSFGGYGYSADVEERLDLLKQQFADVLYASHNVPDLRAADELGPQFIANARKAEIKRMRDEGMTGFLSDSDMDWWDRFANNYRNSDEGSYLSGYRGILPYAEVANSVNLGAYRPGMLVQKGSGMPLVRQGNFADGRFMPLSALQMPPLYGRNDWERIGLLDALSMAESGFSGPSGTLFQNFDLDSPGPYEFITWSPPEGVMASSGTPAKTAIQTYGYGPTETMSDIIARADAYYPQSPVKSGSTATYPEIYGPRFLGEARFDYPTVGVYRGTVGPARGDLLRNPDYDTFRGTPMIYNALRKIGKGGPGIETHPVTHRFEAPEPTVGGDPSASMVPGAQVNQRMLRLTPQVREKIKNMALPAVMAPTFIYGLSGEDEGAGTYQRLYEY